MREVSRRPLQVICTTVAFLTESIIRLRCGVFVVAFEVTVGVIFVSTFLDLLDQQGVEWEWEDYVDKRPSTGSA